MRPPREFLTPLTPPSQLSKLSGNLTSSFNQIHLPRKPTIKLLLPLLPVPLLLHLLKLPLSGSRLQLPLEVPSKSPLLVPLMLEDTSTVLLPRTNPDLECSTPPTLLTPPPQLNLLPLKLSPTFNPLLLLPSTTSKDNKPLLVNSLSLLSSPDSLKVRPTVGCVKPPL